MPANICVLMMLRNEQKRILVSLESIKDVANSLCIFDTGSVDNTIDICKEFSKQNNIELRLKQGEFIDFSTSRNEALNFADTFEDTDFILMLDCNDELRGWKILREYADNNLETDISAFYLSQHWYCGNINKYFNIRLIRAHKNWRYKGVVHEYICNDDPIEDAKKLKLDLDNLYIYQDRTLDDDKSGKRFIRDEVLLKNEFDKNPTDPRTVFYLAQTYACLNRAQDAYDYYKIRSNMTSGFFEEQYESCFQCGILSERLNTDFNDVSLGWYMKSLEIIPRVEPLLKIGQYYQNKKSWFLSYSFLAIACQLSYPTHCNLFVDKIAYEYTRYHLLGIVAFYADRKEEGKRACKIAIENGQKCGQNVSLDLNNLKFYEDNDTLCPPMTKKQFIASKMPELRKDHPKLSDKRLETMAKLLWKKNSLKVSS